MLLPTASDAAISGGALVALILLSVVEVALAVFCIVDIVRRPAVLGERKWVWIIVVLLFNLIGPIIYLAIGRVRPPLPEVHAGPGATGGRVAAAADILYGPASGAEARTNEDSPPPSPPGAKEES